MKLRRVSKRVIEKNKKRRQEIDRSTISSTSKK
jgi:hypothetical protein